jgi:hypothetical protein
MISKEAIEKLETHLISSSEKAKKNEWEIIFGRWKNENKCCPLYASFVLADINNKDLSKNIDYSKHISDFLGEVFSERDVQAFLAGYDNPLQVFLPQHDERIFELGKKIRYALVPSQEKPGDKYMLNAQNITCPSVDEMKIYFEKNEMPSPLSSHYVSCSTCRDNVSKISNFKLNESISDQLRSYEKNWATKLKEKVVQLWKKINSTK